MGIHLRKMHASIFIKIMCVFLAVIFPLCLSGILISIWGQNDIRREVERSVKSSTSLYLNNLQERMNKIFLSELRHINHPDLQKLAYSHVSEDDFYKNRSILNIQAEMTGLVVENKYIDEAAVYLPGISKKITNTFIEDFPEDEFKAAMKIINQGQHLFIFFDNRYYMVVLPLYYDESDNSAPNYLIMARLNNSILVEELQSLTDGNTGGAALLSGGYGLNIYDASQEDIIPYLMEFLEDKEVIQGETYLGVCTSWNEPVIVAYSRLVGMDTTLLVYMPENKFLSSTYIFRIWLWVVAILTITVIVLFTLWIHGLVANPLDRLVRAFRSLEKGELDISISYKGNDEFGYLYKRFNEMCSKLSNLIEEVYENKIRFKNVELKQLQYQINPHFLYNSFFILYNLIRAENNNCAMKLTQHLGSYYSYITKSNSDEVPLEKEVQHVKDYVEIQLIRFSNRIKAEFGDIPEEFLNLPVPRLILQPVIENCFKHGLKNKLSGGILKLYVKWDLPYLSVFIEDNGEELDEKYLATIKELLVSGDIDVENAGLLNVHRRLRIRYGKDSGLYLSKREQNGLRVELRIMLKEEVLQCTVS